MHARSHLLVSVGLLAFLHLFIHVKEVQSSSTTASSTTASNTSASSTASSTSGNTTIFNSSSTTENTTLNSSTNTATYYYSTTTVTPAPTTTLKPVADVMHNTDIAAYVLELTVGQENSSDIQYSTMNLTRDELLDKISVYFNFSFGVSLEISNNSIPQMFTLRVQFLVKQVDNKTEALRMQIMSALSSIAMSGEFDLPNLNMTAETVGEFISMAMDVCTARNICPLGFTCFSEGCQHMCRTRDCSNHGMCYVSVSTDVSVTTICQCDMEYDTEYQGDNCEYSRRGRLQIIAIIAGVLGAACLVFIIVIIILCVKYHRHKSSSNYNISGASYGNNAYDNSHDK